MICGVYTVTPANVYTTPVAMANEKQFWQLHLWPLVGTCLTIHVCLHGENTQPKVVNMMYVGSKQKCLLDSNVLVTINGYCSMFNPPPYLGLWCWVSLQRCCSNNNVDCHRRLCIVCSWRSCQSVIAAYLASPCQSYSLLHIGPPFSYDTYVE